MDNLHIAAELVRVELLRELTERYQAIADRSKIIAWQFALVTVAMITAHLVENAGVEVVPKVLLIAGTVLFLLTVVEVARLVPDLLRVREIKKTVAHLNSGGAV